jgi:maleamate amidohydrolase
MGMTREENYSGVFDGRVGFGASPALLTIDFTRAYTTPGSPFFAEGVVRAVRETVPLLAAARAARIPVIHTKVLYHPSGADGGWFVRKVPALRRMVPGEPLAEIDPAVAPLVEEVVIAKQYPSPFFGTSLASMLTALGVDTLILTAARPAAASAPARSTACNTATALSCPANASATGMTGRTTPTSSTSMPNTATWSGGRR